MYFEDIPCYTQFKEKQYEIFCLISTRGKFVKNKI